MYCLRNMYKITLLKECLSRNWQKLQPLLSNDLYCYKSVGYLLDTKTCVLRTKSISCIQNFFPPHSKRSRDHFNYIDTGKNKRPESQQRNSTGSLHQLIVKLPTSCYVNQYLFHTVSVFGPRSLLVERNTQASFCHLLLFLCPLLLPVCRYILKIAKL